MHVMIRAFAAVSMVALARGTAAAQQPAAPAGALKLAYVNSRQLLEQAPGRAEAEAQFEKETVGLQAQAQRMNDSLQKLIGAYERAQATLTPAQRTTRETAIRQVQGEFQQRMQVMGQQAEQRQQELMAPIMDQINKVIQDMRAEGGYAMIFDTGAQISAIVSADKALDLTDAVLAKLKQLGPPKLPAPAVAAPATPPASAAPLPGRPATQPAGATRPSGRP